MDERTRAALEASIAHHEACLVEDDPNKIWLTIDECKLCEEFLHGDPNGELCVGCPVSVRSRRIGCNDTPFMDALDAWVIWDRDPKNKLARSAYRTAEQAEIDFLKSLRPKE